VSARLVDLDPRWVAEYGAPDGTKQGVSFLCPCCRDRRLAVFFDSPICGSNPITVKDIHRQSAETGHLADHHIGAVLWTRTGDTFEDLTLQPSIDCSGFGHWHGFIVRGVAQ
jgi:hypothetical protein